MLDKVSAINVHWLAKALAIKLIFRSVYFNLSHSLLSLGIIVLTATSDG